MSQLTLALEAGISARHLSFIESGRARPSERVVLSLAKALGLSLRDSNALLEAAGLVPFYSERALGSVELAPFKRVLDLILRGHEPFPALAFDRWWNIVDANDVAQRLFPEIKQAESVATIEILYRPGRLREAILNWEEVAWAALERVRQEATASGYPPQLMELAGRLAGWLEGSPHGASSRSDLGIVACPVFEFSGTVVRTLSTLTTFGGAQDVTLQELRIEQVFPLDAEAEAFFRDFASSAPADVLAPRSLRARRVFC